MLGDRGPKGLSPIPLLNDVLNSAQDCRRNGFSVMRAHAPGFEQQIPLQLEQTSPYRGEALLAEKDTSRSPEAAADKLGYTPEGWNELTPRQKRQQSENYRQAEIDAEQWGVDVRLVRLITMAMHAMASAIGCWRHPSALPSRL